MYLRTKQSNHLDGSQHALPLGLAKIPTGAVGENKVESLI